MIAERQTNGRGRDGRVWQSPRGGLYLSAVLRPMIPLASVPPMTLAIGIGLCDAARIFGAPAVLKWPNDLLVGHRKLAGVLVEAQSQGQRLDAVIVGIGVNLESVADEVPAKGGPSDQGVDDRCFAADRRSSSSPRAAPTWISLAEAAGTQAPIDREAFIAQLLARVERWVERYVGVGLEAVIPAWQDRMAPGLAARATVNGAPMTGQVTGLDLDGALLLRDDAGQIHRIRSGDVEVIRPTL